MAISGSPPLEKAIHDSLAAITAPATGVHKPIRSSTPAPAAIAGGTDDANCELPRKCGTTWQSRTLAVSNRWSRRPLPGQPFGKVENRRCNNSRLRCWPSSQNSQKDGPCSFFRGGLQLNDSTLQPDRNSMGSVVCPEFREYVGDIALHAGFSDGK